MAPQLHMYVSDDVAAALRARARERGVSVSKMLADIVNRDVNRGWPEGWMDRVVGTWPGPWPEVDDAPPDEGQPL